MDRRTFLRVSMASGLAAVLPFCLGARQIGIIEETIDYNSELEAYLVMHKGIAGNTEVYMHHYIDSQTDDLLNFSRSRSRRAIANKLGVRPDRLRIAV